MTALSAATKAGRHAGRARRPGARIVGAHVSLARAAETEPLPQSSSVMAWAIFRLPGAISRVYDGAFHVATGVAGIGSTMDTQLAPLSPDRAILVYWRLPRPNGQTLVCTSYRTPAGLELRAGLDHEPPILQADIATHAEAQQLAGVWRQQITRAAAAFDQQPLVILPIRSAGRPSRRPTANLPGSVPTRGDTTVLSPMSP